MLSEPMNPAARFLAAVLLVTLAPGLMFVLVAVRWGAGILGRVLNPSAPRMCPPNGPSWTH